jgi:hypothetical protein
MIKGSCLKILGSRRVALNGLLFKGSRLGTLQMNSKCMFELLLISEQSLELMGLMIVL